MSGHSLMWYSKPISLFRGVFTIAKWESRKAFKNPMFWLITIYVPLLGASLIAELNSSFRSDMQSFSVSEKISGFVESWLTLKEEKPIGVWDGAGVIKEFPESYKRSDFSFYPSEAEARWALTAEDVDAIFLVGKDFLEKGSLEHKFQDSLNSDLQKKFIHLLRFNILDGDLEMTELVESILKTKTNIVLRESDEEIRAHGFFAKLKYSIFLFWTLAVTFMSIGIMGWTDKTLSSEKENLTFEVLLSSVSPTQVLLGKLSALYFTNFIRLLIWTSLLFVVGIGLGVGTYMTQKALLKLLLPNLSIVFILPIFFSLFLVGFKLRKSSSESREDPQTYNLFFGLGLGFLFSLAAMFCILGPNSQVARLFAFFPLTSPVAVPILSIQNAISTSEVYFAIFLMLILLLISSVRSRRFFKF